MDPEHKLADYLREKGLLDVAVTDKGGYVKGLAQPAILVVKRDGEVLEQWAIRPSTVCDSKSILFYIFPSFLWNRWKETFVPLECDSVAIFVAFSQVWERKRDRD